MSSSPFSYEDLDAPVSVPSTDPEQLRSLPFQGEFMRTSVPLDDPLPSLTGGGGSFGS